MDLESRGEFSRCALAEASSGVSLCYLSSIGTRMNHSLSPDSTGNERFCFLCVPSGGQESIAGGQAALLREPVSALSLPPWGPGHGRITSFLRCPSLGLIFCSNCVPLNIFCIPWLSPLSLDRCKLGSRGVRAFLSDMAR